MIFESDDKHILWLIKQITLISKIIVALDTIVEIEDSELVYAFFSPIIGNNRVSEQVGFDG